METTCVALNPDDLTPMFTETVWQGKQAAQPAAEKTFLELSAGGDEQKKANTLKVEYCPST